MNRSPIHRGLCGSAALLLCALLCARAAGIDDGTVPRGRVGYRFEHIERIEYTDANPIRPDFDWGRFAGQRHLFTFGLLPIEGGYVGGLVGPATHQVHNGEGETVEYDTLCIGVEGSYHWACLPEYGVGALFAGRGLITTRDGGSITEVARDDVTAGSSSKLSWWEAALVVALTHQQDRLRLSAGVEYVTWNVEQDWSLTTGSASTDLEPETHLGLLLGGHFQCTDAVAVTVDMTIVHHVSFRTALTFDF